MADYGDNARLEQMFRPELERDEQLLWTGRPGQGIHFRMLDVLLVPFSMLWGGFAFFWEFNVAKSIFAAERASDSMGGLFSVLFLSVGGFFCLAGCYIIFGRFLLDWYRRRNTFYAITGERVLIASTFFQKSYKSYFFDKLDTLKLNEGKNSRGTIYLQEEGDASLRSWNSGWYINGRHQLEHIENARRVYELLREHRGRPAN